MSVRFLLVCSGAFFGCSKVEGADVLPKIERLDPRFEALVLPGAKLEKIADGFGWAEGPAWNAATGELFFSDVETNQLHAWSAKNGTRIVLENSGYVGAAPFTGREPGSNGITFDSQGRVVFCQHGERRISRLERDGTRTVLVDRYQGKRLNSPNDLVYSRSGDLYFTDPPFGLPGTFDDPEKELPFSGVYRLRKSGELTLLTRELEGPNGIAFSPDEKTLYVANNSPTCPLWMAYDLRADGTLGLSRVLYDAKSFTANRKGFPDGLKVAKSGHLFAAGPEGIYVLTPTGEHLGTLFFCALTSNCAFGPNGALFITVDSAIYRLAPGG
ncbi:MAG: SMP-30/gluconolactonase/LRE family protein [Planctomycetes bacterium]|nr:SMP-30/gluconolactonase/LRE family protein [Planctomycetota bacterium]